MLAGVQAPAAGLQADQPHVLVGNEGMEGAHGVAAAADAGQDIIGQAAFGLQHLGAGLAADDGLEVAHHHGVGVGADDAADEVVGGLHVGDPVADGFVDGVLQGAGAGLDADDFGFQQAHPVDVEGLAAYVLLAHVDDALQAQHGAGGGGGDAVLPGAGLGDDAPLAHVLGQQRLAESVVYLVGAGVGQVFALQVYLRAAQLPRQVFGVVERRGAAHVVGQQVGQAGLEVCIGLHAVVGVFQLGHCGHEGFGDELAAEVAVAAAVVGEYCRCIHRHFRSFLVEIWFYMDEQDRQDILLRF